MILYIFNSVLASLNLPAAIEDTSGTEVPQSLLDKAAYVRKEGGITALETAMNELPELLQRNKDILDEVLLIHIYCDFQLNSQFKRDKYSNIPQFTF